MSTGVYYCPQCGATMPGTHHFGCASLQGVYPPFPPNYTEHLERIARALERIADALERKP